MQRSKKAAHYCLFLFLFLCWRLIIVTLLQWYNFRTARSVTLWCIRQGMSSNCIGSPRWGSPRPVPGLVDWLLQMISPTSAFCGEPSTTAGYSTPSLLCGDHPSGGVKVFVGACIWDEFLDDRCCARTLDPCVSPLLLWFRKRVFSRCRALATAAVGASPCITVIWSIKLKFGVRHPMIKI